MLPVRVFPGADESGFTTVLGPSFSVAPEGEGYRVSWESVKPHFTGALFEIDLKNLPTPVSDPPALSASAGQVTQVESKAAMPGCSGCYFFDADEQWLYVHPSDDQHFFSFE